MTSPHHDHPQPPEPVVWPRFWPLFVGLFPFAVLAPLALWPATRDWINDHPGWATLIGAALVPIWLGLFGGLLARSLDFWLRTLDFVVNRTHGPNLEGWSGRKRICFLLTRGGLMNGYSLPIALWTALAVLIAIFGPTRTPLNDIPWIDAASRMIRGSTCWEFVFGLGIGLGLAAAGAAALGALWLLAALAFSLLTGRTGRLPFATMAALLSTILAICGFLAWSGAVRMEADHGVYPHIFLPFIALTALVAWLAPGVARGLLRGFEGKYREQWTKPELLRSAELFVILPRESDAWEECGFGNNVRSAVDVPFRHPHLLVLPIAFAVLLFPSAYLNFVAVSVGLFTWSVLALAGTHPRLNNVLYWAQRMFFHGVLWAPSLLVIVLASCRFADVSYVATLTNSASSMSLVWFIASIYVVLWYYKYWIGHAIGEQLLDLLRRGAPTDEPVPYPIEEKFRANPYVLREGRCLQTHGTRFAAVGVFQNAKGHGQAWEFYDHVGLFEAIAKKSNFPPGGSNADDPEHANAIRERGDPVEIDLAFGLSELRQRVQVYHVVLDVFLAAIVASFFWLRTLPEPKPELIAEKAPEKQYVLADHLFDPLPGDAEKAGKTPKVVVVFAASGGGTRAAIYAAAVLRGLKEQGALGDVQLCSGVSGGSAAIAYFAILRDDLIRNEAAWDRCAQTLGAPFIDDVLCGTLEWRIAMGTRMGVLLDESLHRHIHGPRTALADGMTLEKAHDLGIIFNSTLVGAEKPGQATDPTEAGSRLIITNVRMGENTLPAKKSQFPQVDQDYLHFVVVNDPNVRLATGAALSSNFPPVFSNAAVDVKNGKYAGRYWVTDGGAAENRGALTMLYVLREALREEMKKPAAMRRKPLPIQIVVAEASAASIDFSQDRGINAAFGAAGKFANQLGLELLDKIKVDFDDLGGKSLDVRFLPMPLVLRSRGGVGTHWKLPAFVTLANPKGDKRPDSEKAKLIISDKQASAMIMDLYMPKGNRYIDKATGAEKELLDEARKWIDGEGFDARFSQHRKNWDELRKDFKALYEVRGP